MSEIAKLYDEVMSGQAQDENLDKTAADVNADGGPEFDANFFEKVAAGDEESVGIINEFIDEAKAEGHSDDEIEEAIGEAMVASGYDTEGEAMGDPEDDEYEVAKMSAYMEGTEQAIVDVLESDLAKEAGITIDDLLEFELGGHFGAGYAETRQEAEEAIQKIAGVKEWAARQGGKAKELGAKLVGKLKSGGKRYGQLMAGGAKGEVGEMAGKRAGNVLKGYRKAHGMRGEALKSLGARAGTAAAAGGAGYGAYRLSKRDKK